MATHKLGKLKFNLSKQGFAYRWGEGDIHRISFGKKDQPSDDEYVNDGYSEYDDEGRYEDGGYNDGYNQDDGVTGYDGDYEDRSYDGGYDDRDYDDSYDDGYDRRDYDGGYDDDYDDRDYDGGYDDDYDRRDYDGGYDDDYEDRGYDGDGYDPAYGEGEYEDDYPEGSYEDRYSDEDADDAYGSDYYESDNPLIQYVEENDWVTYVLLFLLPPLGIYLLWRRNRFEQPIRYAISAASAIWFIVALILIFTSIFGNKDDGQMTILPSLSPSSVVSASPSPSIAPSASAGINTGDNTGDDSSVNTSASPSASLEAGVSPSATPLTGGNSSSGSMEYVYSPATGLYYHSSNTCSNIGEGVSVSRVPVEIAESDRRQSPCPVCMGGGESETMYYATRGGTYYHLDNTCSGMRNPTTYTKEAAEAAGKKACPVCVTKTQQSLQSDAVKFITSSTSDQSNIKVYATRGGTYFHMTSDCSNMKGASQISLRDALLAGKKACPTCCKAAGTLVYCTKGGEDYHLKSNCRGMKNAAQVTLAEALVLGKHQCTTCIKGSVNTGTDTGTSSSSEVYVYGTSGGKYYHTNSTCSGMANAQRYTLKSMLQAGREACPTCASSANVTVYAAEGGTYFHSYATCSGMENAKSGTVAQALAYGYKRCPRCWGSTGGGTSGGDASTDNTPSAENATANNTYVYATRNGTYYHTNSTCTGMKNASRITLKTAIDAGKTACPTCASAANRVVYSTDGGKYYHAASSCPDSGMRNGERRTLAEALMLGQTACSDCFGKSSSDTQTPDSGGSGTGSSNTYKTGTSGIKVYATREGKYYHVKSNCSGMQGASYITLETALNYGKTACPTCISAANRTVYATRSGKYYHYSRDCAGSGAKSGTLGEALAYGFKPCPDCVSKTSTNTPQQTANFKEGTSGIKVYATVNGKYYHAKSNCSGMQGAYHIPLERALNYGKTACPDCLAAGNYKVYAVKGSSYYHYSKACAGSGAVAGTLAEARAYGLKPCTKCTTSTSGDGGIGNGTSVSYPASADSKVYIDLLSNYYYYHKSSKCSTMGITGATPVTLQYAKDWGYKACPYCNPPTSIE